MLWIEGGAIWIGSVEQYQLAYPYSQREWLEESPGHSSALENLFLHELSHVGIAVGHTDGAGRASGLCPDGSINCAGGNRSFFNYLKPADVAALICLYGAP